MKCFLLGFLLVVPVRGCARVNAATDVSGIWLVQQERDFRGNPTRPYECAVTQQRDQLEVRCGNASNPMKGIVRGRTLTWGLEKTGIPPMIDDRLLVTYRAEINDAGTKLTGTWRLASSVLDEQGSFEALKK